MNNCCFFGGILGSSHWIIWSTSYSYESQSYFGSTHFIQRVFSQLDKEAVAKVFGVTKFHLYGRDFVLYTDHKTFTHIFNPSRSIPLRPHPEFNIGHLDLEHIVTLLFIVQAKKGSLFCWCDAWAASISQIPLRLFLSLATFQWQCNNSMPVNENQIKDGISGDPILSRVRRFILHG